MEKSFNIIRKCLADLPHEFNISGKKFVITGNSEILDREKFREQIEKYGGKVLGSVSSKIDYVIVCSLGCEEWKFGNYGSKLEKALDLKEQGAELSIIDERVVHEFFDLNQATKINFLLLQDLINETFTNKMFNGEDAELLAFIQQRAVNRKNQ